MVKDHNTLPM